MDDLVTECKQIQEDSLYTAETHYIIANKLKTKAFWLKFLPGLIAVVAAFSSLVGAPNWVSYITLVAALITVLNITLKPEEESDRHVSAAKYFTVLKHDARALHETFSHHMSKECFYHEVRNLRQQYNQLITLTSPTNEKAFEKARENIKTGKHQADFREEGNK